MHTSAPNHTSPSEVRILARILGNDSGRLPPRIARYLLTVGFSDADKAHMHELALRNQDGKLSPAEQDELLAYAKTGTLLSILKSKARRVLNVKPKKRTLN
jgi:hypothetical protein